MHFTIDRCLQCRNLTRETTENFAGPFWFCCNECHAEAVLDLIDPVEYRYVRVDASEQWLNDQESAMLLASCKLSRLIIAEAVHYSDQKDAKARELRIKEEAADRVRKAKEIVSQQKEQERLMEKEERRLRQEKADREKQAKIDADEAQRQAEEERWTPKPYKL